MAKNITDSIAINSSGWDGDQESLQLYDAELVIDTPKFKTGTIVKVISFEFATSQCQIWDDSGETVIDEFPIKLVINKE